MVSTAGEIKLYLKEGLKDLYQVFFLCIYEFLVSMIASQFSSHLSSQHLSNSDYLNMFIAPTIYLAQGMDEMQQSQDWDWETDLRIDAEKIKGLIQVMVACCIQSF